ncbi:MAG: phosphoribosylanthranilate isomerase [Planctomycetaceae bacterium]|jgi:phosphoribosylanthranilate isomerase/indole-3-glycerol phosphate synthase/phosphoribosylanthranilate isomerase|nr:phosphoribosylanthranilate isomerase [Planctomycetaceae bacterium]
MRIKICGMTTPESACRCLEVGADMIGLIFYPPSPRHVDVSKIRKILDAVEPFRKQGRQTVLVVVDSLPDELDSRIDFVQLHGSFSGEFPAKRIYVVKNRQTRDRLLKESATKILPDSTLTNSMLTDSFYLLEMSQGFLPGGNGMIWNWLEAKEFCERFPTFLAGGITPENVLAAITQAQPYGIDVSSGVESSPGVKDFNKVQQLIETVFNHENKNKLASMPTCPSCNS